MPSPLDLLANGPIYFLPVSPAASARGTVSNPYGTPVLVRGYVTSKRLVHVSEANGLVTTTSLWIVTLFDDPATLNGGVGVRQDDAFTWRGLTVVAMGPPRPTGIGSVQLPWTVDCLLKT